MPPIESFDLRDVATLWTKAGADEHGEPLLSDPEEIRLRWQRADEVVPDPDGQPVRVVGNAVVRQVIEVGSVLWLGRLSELETKLETKGLKTFACRTFAGLNTFLSETFGGKPQPTGNPSDLLVVTEFRSVPDLKGRNHLRSVLVSRFGDTLPERSS